MSGSGTVSAEILSIVGRFWRDRAFRRRFEVDPRSAIENAGFVIDDTTIEDLARLMRRFDELDGETRQHLELLAARTEEVILEK